MSIETSQHRQREIERRFSNIANAPYLEDSTPEVIDLLRDLFEYVKDIEQRLLAKSEG
jgi:hypothetical protein